MLVTRILVLIFSCSLLAAQDHSKKTLFPHLFEGQEKAWKAPLQEQTWRSPKPWLMIGLSAGSFALDGSVSRDLRNDQSFKDFNRVFDSDALEIGLHVFPLGLVAAAKLADNAGATEYGWKSAEAVLHGFLVSRALKLATQRPRPHREKEYGFWEGGGAFPSGHATVAWSIAATTAHHFDDHEWVAWVVYPMAGLISFSRITSGDHFASDVVVGSALGFVIGKYIVR